MRWLRPFFRVLLFPAVVIFAVGFPDSFFPNATLFLIFPPALVALLIWSLIQIARSAIAAWRRAWGMAAVHFLAIVVTALAFHPAADAVKWVSHYAHLTVFVAWNAVNPIQPDQREGPAEIFNWDGQGLAAGASESRYLVYDPSGKTRNDIGKKPTPNFPGASIETRHLAGNYYLRVEYYP